MDVRLDRAAAAFWEYFAPLLDAADLGRGWSTSDERYFRFSGRGVVPGMTGLAPAVRFESSTYVPVSEIKYEAISVSDRDRLHEARPSLQQHYGGPGIIRIEDAGDTQVYIKVVGDGSPADRDHWPDYAQWFITTQHHLRAALAAFYTPSTVDGGHSPPAPPRVTESRVSVGLVEALNAKAYAVQAMAERVGTQPEKELVLRFEQYLKFHHHKARDWKIAMPDGGPLRIDIVDVDTNIIYEAKAAADRMSVRLALGQLLDYEHNVRAERPGTRMAVLLPDRPAPDLVELLTERKIGCVVENKDRSFTDLTGLGLCPPDGSLGEG
jgi:hypothetical protein